MTNRKEMKSYMDENEVEMLKEVSNALGLTMSKTIALCVVQGLELYKAELLGKAPKNLMEKYLKK